MKSPTPLLDHESGDGMSDVKTLGARSVGTCARTCRSANCSRQYQGKWARSESGRAHGGSAEGRSFEPGHHSSV